MLNNQVNSRISFVSGSFTPGSYSVSKWATIRVPLIKRIEIGSNFTVNQDNIYINKDGYYRVCYTYLIAGYEYVSGCMLSKIYNNTRTDIVANIDGRSSTFSVYYLNEVVHLETGATIYLGLYTDKDGSFSIVNSPNRYGTWNVEYLGGGDN